MIYIKPYYITAILVKLCILHNVGFWGPFLTYCVACVWFPCKLNYVRTFNTPGPVGPNYPKHVLYPIPVNVDWFTCSKNFKV